LLRDAISSKEQAPTKTAYIFPDLLSARIYTQETSGFKIKTNTDSLQKLGGPLCSVQELTNMRKETTFGTCPPPGVGGPEVYPLLPWDCADESHWTEDLLQAVNTNNTLLKTDVAGGVPETLNTPTMEVKELTFPSSSFTIVPRDEEVPTSILSSDEELLGDMNIDVMDASSLPSTSSHTYTNNDFEFFPDNSTNIEDVWGSLGSPSMQAVSLLEIEGRSKEDTEVATFDAPVEVTKVETDDRDLLNWAMETSEVLNSVAAAPEDDKDNVFVTLDTSQLQLFADYRPRNYSDETPATVLSPPANNINCPPATVTSQTPSSFGPVRTPRGARTPARYSPTLSETYRPAVRRGRGRPPVAPGRAITPRVSRAGTLVSGSESDGMYISDGNLTDADISDLRYRRMRDLNNEASKRCRENRKSKFQILEEELDELKARNLELTVRWRRLESAVQKIKQQYIEFVAQGAQGQLPLLPDVATLWSDMPNQE